MPIQNTPTSKTTLFPVKTGTSTGNFGIQLNPQNPASAPNIVDNNGTVIATWNATNKSWSALDTKTTVGSDNTPIGAFLNQNQETFTKNTTKIINDLPDDQKNAFQSANTFSPYTNWAKTNAPTTTPASPTGGDPNSTNNQQGGEGESSPASAEQLNSFGGFASRSDTKKDFGRFVYPLERGNELHDYVQFSIFDYGTKKLSENVGEFGDRNFGDRKGTVWLPIQSQISDSNAVKWNENSMNAGQLEALKIFDAGVEGGVQGALTKLLSTTEQVTQNASTNDAVSAVIKSYFAEQGTGIAGGTLLPRLYGAVLNPNVELLFEGPALRPFNFTFKLSARSKEEAKNIRSIIRFFKQGMAPQRAQTTLFLKAPHVFEIAYKFKNDRDHKGLNKIKGKCALQTFNVDYTPEGTYMAYDDDGTMVSYLLQMQFMELEPVYHDDYKGPDDEIGY